jgi:hypothetical protein
MIIDTLETIFQLLSGLEYLNEIGCDQSTYHHMFFAIHNAAKRIIECCEEEEDSIKDIAREQIYLNNNLLRSAAAYENDLFKLRFYGDKIESDLEELGIEPRNEALQTVEEYSIQVFRAGPIVKERPSRRKNYRSTTGKKKQKKEKRAVE